MKPSVDIYLDEEYDRFDTNIEFYIDPNHTFSISIDPSGDIAWAYLWGEHEDHGSGSLFKKDELACKCWGCKGCTCPVLDGYQITGSSCPIHGLKKCE